MNHPDRVQLTPAQRDALHGVERGGCEAPAMTFMLLMLMLVALVLRWL